jgi:hypothetical protein
VSVDHDIHTRATAPAGWNHASLADRDMHETIRLFLEREAGLIDDRRYRHLLGLVSEDFTYLMPVTFTPDNPAKPHYNPNVAHRR